MTQYTKGNGAVQRQIFDRRLQDKSTRASLNTLHLESLKCDLNAFVVYFDGLARVFYRWLYILFQIKKAQSPIGVTLQRMDGYQASNNTQASLMLICEEASSNVGQPFPTMAGTRVAMHLRESRGRKPRNESADRTAFLASIEKSISSLLQLTIRRVVNMMEQRWPSFSPPAEGKSEHRIRQCALETLVGQRLEPGGNQVHEEAVYLIDGERTIAPCTALITHKRLSSQTASSWRCDERPTDQSRVADTYLHVRTLLLPREGTSPPSLAHAARLGECGAINDDIGRMRGQGSLGMCRAGHGDDNAPALAREPRQNRDGRPILAASKPPGGHAARSVHCRRSNAMARLGEFPLLDAGVAGRWAADGRQVGVRSGWRRVCVACEQATDRGGSADVLRGAGFIDMFSGGGDLMWCTGNMDKASSQFGKWFWALRYGRWKSASLSELMVDRAVSISLMGDASRHDGDQDAHESWREPASAVGRLRDGRAASALPRSGWGWDAVAGVSILVGPPESGFDLVGRACVRACVIRPRGV
ncbi:hypothetical protein BJ912DRAFT_1081063 [Pholiota molesta]|nr:hypothetical protein BJ912DRAFT_1081063 [Pholiota molesta]